MWCWVEAEGLTGISLGLTALKCHDCINKNFSTKQEEKQTEQSGMTHLAM